MIASYVCRIDELVTAKGIDLSKALRSSLLTKLSEAESETIVEQLCFFTPSVAGMLCGRRAAAAAAAARGRKRESKRVFFNTLSPYLVTAYLVYVLPLSYCAYLVKCLFI